MKHVYTEVTERVLQKMRAGTVPWVRPFTGAGETAVPVNAITNRPYRGINLILFMCNLGRWGSMRFLTYKQAAAVGGQVRKGETGSKIYFYKMVQRRDDEDKAFPFLAQYTVFNVDQVDGLPPEVIHGPNGAPVPPVPVNADDRNRTIDGFITTTGANFKEGATKSPMYVPSLDMIVVPPFDQFHGADGYYATTFHELGHWTGHKTRLNRDLSGRFGTGAYAAEELIAELTSAFLCSEFGISNTETNTVAYLQSWIGLLEHDARAIFTAASAAQKAADFLCGRNSVPDEGKAAA